MNADSTNRKSYTLDDFESALQLYSSDSRFHSQLIDGGLMVLKRARDMEVALRAFMDAIHYAQDEKAMKAAIRQADQLARQVL